MGSRGCEKEGAAGGKRKQLVGEASSGQGEESSGGQGEADGGRKMK